MFGTMTATNTADGFALKQFFTCQWRTVNDMLYAGRELFMRDHTLDDSDITFLEDGKCDDL